MAAMYSGLQCLWDGKGLDIGNISSPYTNS